MFWTPSYLFFFSSDVWEKGLVLLLKIVFLLLQDKLCLWSIRKWTERWYCEGRTLSLSLKVAFWLQHLEHCFHQRKRSRRKYLQDLARKKKKNAAGHTITMRSGFQNFSVVFSYNMQIIQKLFEDSRWLVSDGKQKLGSQVLKWDIYILGYFFPT